MRLEVKWFSEQMNKRLEENAFQDTFGWEELSDFDLIHAIQVNIRDVQIASLDGDVDAIIKHAADIANYAMMIADNERSEPK